MQWSQLGKSWNNQSFSAQFQQLCSTLFQGGRRWQAFDECKKTSLLSPSRHLLIQNVFSAYYQNCNNLNLKLDNTTLSCNLKLKKALENVSIAKNLNIATKYHMLGLKIFVQVQTLFCCMVWRGLNLHLFIKRTIEAG